MAHHQRTGGKQVATYHLQNEGNGTESDFISVLPKLKIFSNRCKIFPNRCIDHCNLLKNEMNTGPHLTVFKKDCTH